MNFTVTNTITKVSMPEFDIDEIVSTQISLVADILNRQLEGSIREAFFEAGHDFETDEQFYQFCKSERCHVLVDAKTGINHLFIDDVEIFAWDYDTTYEVSTENSTRGILTINTFSPKS